jgi:hypothetical protein
VQQPSGSGKLKVLSCRTLTILYKNNDPNLLDNSATSADEVILRKKVLRGSAITDYSCILLAEVS